MRVSKKIWEEFLTNNFVITEEPSLWEDEKGKMNTVYRSKIDNGYFAFDFCLKDEKHLLRRGITEQLQSTGDGGVVCIGFNPEEQKWYGWSHRAIYGFGVGSECVKGKVHYNPENKEAFLELLTTSNLNKETHDSQYYVKDGGVLERAVFKGCDDKSQDKFIGDISEYFHPYPKKWGKGEWEAKTLEDAKQMAIDFARGVS